MCPDRANNAVRAQNGAFWCPKALQRLLTGQQVLEGGGKDEVYRVANWLYGCHPYHNYSFVAVVGAARPKQVFYGNNRADFSFIPGNVAPGLLFRKPDHFENFDDWPFLWGQNEGTIAGNTQYIIFGSSLKDIVTGK